MTICHAADHDDDKDTLTLSCWSYAPLSRLPRASRGQVERGEMEKWRFSPVSYCPPFNHPCT